MRYLILTCLFFCGCTSLFLKANELPLEEPAETIPCSHPDFDALIAIYNSTNGANWTRNFGWVDGAAGTDCNVCQWEGVTCNPDNRVTRIRLNFNNMIGPLPPELGDLSELISFEAGNSGLTGNIPAEIGQLTKCTLFWACCNDLSGTLPDLSSMISLETFSLPANTLTGPFPTELVNLPNLHSIYLNQNNLSGPIPNLSPLAPTLELLYLGDNNFTGPYPVLGTMPLLEVLDIEQIAWSGPLPPAYNPDNLPMLRELDLRGCGINENLPVYWSGFTQMNDLYLSDNQFTGPLPDSWSAFSDIRYLWLDNNNLEGCYPASWQAMCNPGGVFITKFDGNPLLPDGGSFLFWRDEFCGNGTPCSEDCPPDLIITEEIDILDWLEEYPDCTVLQGNLTVDGVSSNDLNVLDQLTHVGGTITYRNANASRIRGIDNIVYAGGLTIFNYPNLTSFGNSVSGPALALETIAGDLQLINLPSLQSMDRLSGLTQAERIYLVNTGFPDLESLRQVNAVRVLSLESNADMLRLWEDISNRNGVNGYLLDTLNIVSNPLLASIDYGPIGEVRLGLGILGNPQLTDCAIAPVCDGLASTIETTFVFANAGDCLDLPALEAACLALPVSWMNFTATARQKTVDLTWTTAAETNNGGFTVQRSIDGRVWNGLADVPATYAGPDGLHRYAFTDENPPGGELLYRIRQNDLDGREDFSAVQSVFMESAGSRVFPNPASDRFTLVAAAAQSVGIHTADGRMIRTVQHNGPRSQVQREGLKSGVYWLRFSASGEVVRLVIR